MSINNWFSFSVLTLRMNGSFLRPERSLLLISYSISPKIRKELNTIRFGPKMQSFHCNACMRQLKLFGDPSLPGHSRSYFTACKHIFCHNCKQKSGSNCWICRRPTQFMEIRKEMPKYHRMNFETLTKGFEALNIVARFQASQDNYTTNRLNEILKRTEDKNNEIIRKAHKLQTNGNALAQRVHRWKFMNEKIKEYE